jgi:predicted dehydrogenase
VAKSVISTKSIIALPIVAVNYGCSPQFVDWLYDPYRNGAGVIMDYCCYGAALTCMFLGLPNRVSTIAGRLRKSDLPAEDNAVMIMQHATAISTATASWTQSGHMTSYEPILYGDKGTLTVERQIVFGGC